jgi:hypothetical protein
VEVIADRTDASPETLGSPPDDRLLILPVVLLAVLTPLAFEVVVWAFPGSELDRNQRVAFSLADVALALIVITAVPLWRNRFRPRLLGLLTIGLLLTLAVALVANPSPRGFDLAWRLLGVAATATLVVRSPPRGRT